MVYRILVAAVVMGTFFHSNAVFAGGPQPDFMLPQINVVEQEDSGETSNPSDEGGQTSNPGDFGGDTSNSGGSGGCSPGQLCNPLKTDSLVEFITAIIEVLLVFAVPIIVLMIMYAGFLYVTARGEPGQISKAHSALTWAIVGGVIVLGAKLIIEIIQGTIDAL